MSPTRAREAEPSAAAAATDFLCEWRCWSGRLPGRPSVASYVDDRLIAAGWLWLAEYPIPVNADVPSLEAILVEEHEPHVKAPGIKGVREIGITGIAGAVPNAVWHATGHLTV